jgi:hypothetical protein
VRDDGSHLAYGGHLLHLQHVLVRLLELAGLLVDAVFESVGPSGDLGLRQKQLSAHVVERLREVADLVVRVDGNLAAQLAFGEALSALLKFTQRISNHDADEQSTENNH